MKPKIFLCEFRHDGRAYGFDIAAEDLTEARRQLRSIQGNAEIVGELIARMPASIPGASWYMRLRCWIMNLLRSQP